MLFIRAQAAVRTDGFTVRAGFTNTCTDVPSHSQDLHGRSVRADRRLRADDETIRTQSTIFG